MVKHRKFVRVLPLAIEVQLRACGYHSRHDVSVFPEHIVLDLWFLQPYVSTALVILSQPFPCVDTVGPPAQEALSLSSEAQRLPGQGRRTDAVLDHGLLGSRRIAVAVIVYRERFNILPLGIQVQLRSCGRRLGHDVSVLPKRIFHVLQFFGPGLNAAPRTSGKPLPGIRAVHPPARKALVLLLKAQFVQALYGRFNAINHLGRHGILVVVIAVVVHRKAVRILPLGIQVQLRAGGKRFPKGSAVRIHPVSFLVRSVLFPCLAVLFADNAPALRIRAISAPADKALPSLVAFQIGKGHDRHIAAGMALCSFEGPGLHVLVIDYRIGIRLSPDGIEINHRSRISDRAEPVALRVL